MPVRDIPAELERLTALRNGVPAQIRDAALRKALGDRVNVIVAKAAAVMADLGITSMIPDLCATFDRLLIDPVKRDPKCWGKKGIAEALKHLGHSDSEVFLRGLQHVQFEPVWGGEEDTAATLRSVCALALLGCTDLMREEKLWHIMRLLTERSPALRKDAAIALEFLDGREAALLLRLKARMGDEDPGVMGQVFESLLHIEGEAGVSFVLEFLKAPKTEVREEAALALGASRLPCAVAALKHAASCDHPPVQLEVLFRAIGISRREDAAHFLVEVVRHRTVGEALEALKALQLYGDSAEIREEIGEAVASRSEGEIQRQFERFRKAS